MSVSPASSSPAARGSFVAGGKLPVTAFVVTFNEARRLRDCLRSIGFCEQLIVIDLGSSDESVAIAKECGAEVHHHERVPIADMVLHRMQHLARNDWRMRFDPDEVLDPRLLPDVVRLMGDAKVGMIFLPYQYHFMGRPLGTTFWGGVNHMRVFFHKDRSELRPMVHQGQACLPGYAAGKADERGMYPVKHYWVENYAQLFEKHRRYLGKEGETRHALGERFGWLRMAAAAARALGVGLIRKSGWRGGLDGWGLSFFYAWYIARAHLALRAHERMLARRGDGR